MRVQISRLTPVSDVQEKFNQQFPFLKIEFCLQSPSGKRYEVKMAEKCVGDFQPSLTDGFLDIDPEMKVSELGEIIKDKLGLTAQVFRRSGSLWLQTTMTEHWTLAKQNEHGMELCSTAEIPAGKNRD